MKTKELYNLLDKNQDKFEIIDKIMDLHPSFGVEIGWSRYVGGMMDTGNWFREKLLTVPIHELKAHYKIWSTPVIIDELTPERILELQNNYFERYGVWLTV